MRSVYTRILGNRSDKIQIKEPQSKDSSNRECAQTNLPCKAVRPVFTSSSQQEYSGLGSCSRFMCSAEIEKLKQINFEPQKKGRKPKNIKFSL